jgi:hypothetical protein
VDLDAEHRALVTALEHASSRCVTSMKQIEEMLMGRGILLWLLGVPIPIIILLWLFFR